MAEDSSLNFYGAFFSVSFQIFDLCLLSNVQ